MHPLTLPNKHRDSLHQNMMTNFFKIKIEIMESCIQIGSNKFCVVINWAGFLLSECISDFLNVLQ